jgi:hypothetical protein
VRSCRVSGSWVSILHVSLVKLSGTCIYIIVASCLQGKQDRGEQGLKDALEFITENHSNSSHGHYLGIIALITLHDIIYLRFV